MKKKANRSLPLLLREEGQPFLRLQAQVPPGKAMGVLQTSNRPRTKIKASGPNSWYSLYKAYLVGAEDSCKCIYTLYDLVAWWHKGR